MVRTGYLQTFSQFIGISEQNSRFRKTIFSFNTHYSEFNTPLLRLQFRIIHYFTRRNIYNYKKYVPILDMICQVKRTNYSLDFVSGILYIRIRNLHPYET